HSFDGDGKKIIDFDGFATDIAIQGDKIVIVGSDTVGVIDRHDEFAVARLNSDGSFDTTFSGDGKNEFEFSQEANAVAIDSQNRIIMVGDNSTSSNNQLVTVARLVGTNGAGDTTFGIPSNLGHTTMLFPGHSSFHARAVLIQSGDRIVVVGDTH